MNIRFNLILSSTHSSSKWPLNHGVPHQNALCCMPFPDHLILIDFNTRVILGAQNRSWSSLVNSVLRSISPVSSSHLRPHIFLSTPLLSSLICTRILMFVPCIIRRSRNYQHYALICTTPLFYILAPTCFGNSLPSSRSFLDPSELLEIQIEWVVYLKYITDKRIGVQNTRSCISSNSDGSKKLPDDGRLLPKHVWASI
jgi:hypothetical protein